MEQQRRTAALLPPTALWSALVTLLTATAVIFWATNSHAADAAATETFAKRAEGSTATVDHSVWDGLLTAYVVPSADGVNRVKYQDFKANDAKTLKGYIAQLQATDPATLNRAEQFAFWANLYNAKTIDVILDHYPVKSIRDISIGGGLFSALKKSVGAGGPWKSKIIEVSGVELSLDDVEHKILRKYFGDPRVHYAVNCASYGCPNLGTKAFTAANLDDALDAGARAFINHSRGIDVQQGKVKASSIYSWFATDFGGSASAVLKHARQYATPELSAKLEGISAISSYDYDWKLNDVK